MSSEFLVARLSRLPPAPCLHAFEVDGEHILLVRTRDAVFAVGAKCPHAGAPLAEGALCGTRLVCPWHQSVFDVETGSRLEPPALDGLPRHRVRVDGDKVFLVAEPIAPSWSPIDVRREEILAVLGAGAAGQAAAEEMRAAGWDGRIVLVGREPDPPYDRTNLSKMFLSGDASRDELPLRREGDAFYERLGIERLTRTIERLDAPGKTVHFTDGSSLAYSGAVLATGGEPRPLPIPGGERARLLRSLADAERLRDHVREGARAVIVGASFIGLEAASALRKAGVEVSVIAPVGVPFERPLGREVGAAIQALHERNGVRFFLEDEAVSIAGHRVHLKSGGSLPADLIIAGLGVRPATDFVEGVARSEDGGIVVDDRLHAGHGLFAAGDVARFPLPADGGKSARIEHWRVAMQHGRLAARNLAGKPASLRESGFVPYFWTYHFGERMNYVGHAENWDEVVFDGRPDAPPCTAYYVRGGKIRAAFTRGRETEAAALHELMRLDRLPRSVLDGGGFDPRSMLTGPFDPG